MDINVARTWMKEKQESKPSSRYVRGRWLRFRLDSRPLVPGGGCGMPMSVIVGKTLN